MPPSPTPPPPALPPEEQSRLRRSADQLLAALDRLVPVVRVVASGVRILAWSTIGVAVLFLATLLLFGEPAQLTWVAVGLLLASNVVAGIAMLLFHGALVEVLGLPAALRRLPAVASTNSEELARLVRESREREQPSRWGFPGDVFRAGRLLLRTHAALPSYGSILRFVSRRFLLAAGVSVLFAPFLIAFTLAVSLAVVTF